MEAGCAAGSAAKSVDGLACLEEAHNLGCRAAQKNTAIPQWNNRSNWWQIVFLIFFDH